MKFPHIAYGTPRKLPNAKELPGRVVVLDIAFAADSGSATFDKVTGVYNAGAIHEEQQPSHLVIADTSICVTRCAEEYGNPCESFCPADVYEIATGDDGGKRMQINFSNCVHCKTCDVADPYQLITWTVPTDAGGPKYMGM